MRLRLEGAENLPRDASGRVSGGWIGAGLPHRTWIDPFVVIDLLPARPRLVFFGDGPAIFRTPARRFVARRLGGIVPIWAGRRRDTIDEYLGAARSALEAGAVFLLFPETGPPVPVERARPLGNGVAYVALRTGAPIVPLVLGGTHELFRGRRIVLRVLPALDPRALAGLGQGEAFPEPWSAAERRAARQLVAELSALCAAAVEAAHRSVEPQPGRRKRWLMLTHLWS
ncbi:MAG TPA: lysophospholipid acyltransferase family protein [Candidatus Limnocylindrales bacterium]